MKILQILEESPSLDFTLPIFEFTDDNCEILFSQQSHHINIGMMKIPQI